MTNQQARIIGSAIALLAGTVAATTGNLNINVGITITIIAGVLFLVEYFRSQRN